MKHLVLILALLVLSASTYAEIPAAISYQGKLMQPDGIPVPDDKYSIRFSVYDAMNAQMPLWSDVFEEVQTRGGMFSVILGSLPEDIFDTGDRWLGIKVGNDAEMLPRQKIASVAYARTAGKANTVVDGAITSTKIADDAVTSGKIAQGAVTADKLATGVAMPPGAVIMWSGSATAIPQGWALCNGQDGTPDLRAKFVVGAGDGSGYSVGEKGGFAQVTLTSDQMPSHSHVVNDPGHSHETVTHDTQGGGPTVCRPIHSWEARPAFGSCHDTRSTTGISLQNKGGDQPHENRPPYYALCFIMKLGY